MLKFCKMALVENLPRVNPDSEMEEGEIVDDLDDLSDISSDEEFLLRQRLHVLETYNNVLERKKAKSVSIESDLEDGFPHLQNTSNDRCSKSHYKQKRKKDLMSFRISTRNKDHKKKTHRKKKLETKIISETSEESDDEYRNKRRKLANAVSFDKIKNDTSSLSARLKKMLHPSHDIESLKFIETGDSKVNSNFKTVVINDLLDSPLHVDNCSPNDMKNEKQKDNNDVEICELIDLSNDDDVKSFNDHKQDAVDKAIKDNNEEISNENNLGDSDEDLELLRQHALKTKSSKMKLSQPETLSEPENKPLLISEDDESYTAELRLICLKSAYLKKAIEIKRKQKLKKRLSQSSILPNEFILGEDISTNQIDSQNNTDIESVDMDIGSDVDEKIKDFEIDSAKIIVTQNESNIESNETKNMAIKPKDDELDEDEDLLRAKLLTSLSKNLPNLIDPNILNSIDAATHGNKSETTDKKQIISASEPKRFIIKLGESDSEEHEATKNLTKMHMKQQQSDFEQQLDLFLKFTRMKVEKQENPVVQQPPGTEKTSERFVAKSVKNLPKSEQLEYKNLVKRMAELEKIKKARQSSMNLLNKPEMQLKETLKPRNVSMDNTKLLSNNNIDEQIALSRKKIADESANMLRLKEEATKLSQKYKIVATELRNITTAITLNKKQQRSAQTRLSKIRHQHQALLKSSSFKHSQNNGFIVSLNSNKNNVTTKLQKENDPNKEEFNNPLLLKSMKVSVINDFKDDMAHNPRLSIQVDITNNKKVVKIPKSTNQDTNDASSFDSETKYIEQNVVKEIDCNHHSVENTERRNSREVLNDTNQGNRRKKKDADDYKSPLEALDAGNWKEDPNAFLCPFEVGGNCKDPDCKYLHLNTNTKQ
ncbi:uncharacterized protein ACR2FA_005783 [Aphomia sociella]